MMHHVARKVMSVNVRAGLAVLGLLSVLGLLVISLSAPPTGYAQTTGPSPTPAPGGTATPGPSGTLTPGPSGTVGPGATNTPASGTQGHPNLTISKTVNPAQAPVGTTVIFTVVVTNNGTADATDVTVTDPVPSQYQVLSASTTKGAVQLAGQLVTVTIGTMAPGEVVTITIITRAQTPTLGPVTNRATAVYHDPNSGNPNSSSVDASVDASIIKSELPHSGKSDFGFAWLLALAVACGSLAWLARRRPATGK